MTKAVYVPAEPGTMAVTLQGDWWRVLAWEVSGAHAEPVTLCELGDDDDDDVWGYVVHPSGQVETIGGGETWETTDLWYRRLHGR